MPYELILSNFIGLCYPFIAENEKIAFVKKAANRYSDERYPGRN
ncbi:hypothetical protein [Clostridium sp. KNHs205]|nr:hypothetical protein [Clostridium sp. KNHs205]